MKILIYTHVFALQVHVWVDSGPNGIAWSDYQFCGRIFDFGTPWTEMVRKINPPITSCPIKPVSIYISNKYVPLGIVAKIPIKVH